MHCRVGVQIDFQRKRGNAGQLSEIKDWLILIVHNLYCHRIDGVGRRTICGYYHIGCGKTWQDWPLRRVGKVSVNDHVAGLRKLPWFGDAPLGCVSSARPYSVFQRAVVVEIATKLCRAGQQDQHDRKDNIKLDKLRSAILTTEALDARRWFNLNSHH